MLTMVYTYGTLKPILVRKLENVNIMKIPSHFRFALKVFPNVPMRVQLLSMEGQHLQLIV